MTTRYDRGGIKVTIGKSQEVKLPPRVLRGRCTCMHFDTDKSFLLPMSIPGIRGLHRFYVKNPLLTVLVNGHTDLVGDAAYNRTLSEERAKAVAAYLQNRVPDWLAWYSAPQASKRWGTVEDQHMLQTVHDAADAPYYAGPITGGTNAATTDAIRRFQGDHGLATDGVAGQSTRSALIQAYMELEGTTLPATATLVTHGCGETHPVDATTAADQGNRRVEIFLFDGPVDPAPTDPCPLAGCAQYPVWVDQATETVDLCAPVPKQRLVLTLLDHDDKPRPGVAYTLKVGFETISDVTGDDGRIEKEIDEGETSGTLRFDDIELTLQINALEPASTVAGVQGRLRNLGYATGEITGSMNADTTDAVHAFQVDHALPPTGTIDPPTRAKLQAVYGS